MHLSSVNPSLVNGEVVRGSLFLKHQDILTFGDALFQVRWVPKSLRNQRDAPKTPQRYVTPQKSAVVVPTALRGAVRNLADDFSPPGVTVKNAMSDRKTFLGMLEAAAKPVPVAVPSILSNTSTTSLKKAEIDHTLSKAQKLPVPPPIKVLTSKEEHPEPPQCLLSPICKAATLRCSTPEEMQRRKQSDKVVKEPSALRQKSISSKDCGQGHWARIMALASLLVNSKKQSLESNNHSEMQQHPL